MSHFTVLVIGEKPEAQLQPFHEYECTGIKDEYVVFVSAKEDLVKKFEEHKADYSSLDEFAKDYYGYEKNEAGIYGRLTNPNSKWDWYVLGGRWNDFFQLKDGTRSNQALLQDIDFHHMYAEAQMNAEKMYDGIQKEFGGEIPKLEFLWKELLKDESLTIDQKREKYWNQAANLKLTALRNTFHDTRNEYQDYLVWGDIEEFQCSREEYTKKCVQKADVTFAVVRDSKWYEKGSMGWWGCVSDEKEQFDWNKQFYDLLHELDGGTLLSVYDCHI